MPKLPDDRLSKYYDEDGEWTAATRKEVAMMCATGLLAFAIAALVFWLVGKAL